MRSSVIFFAFLQIASMVGFFQAQPQIPDGQGRKRKIRNLVALIKDGELAKKDRPKIVQAVLKLGEIKAVEAVPQLTDLLDFHVSATGVIKIREIPPLEDIYPAIKALVEIGRPGVPAMLDSVASRDRSERFLTNAKYTLILIYKTKAAVKEVLEKAAEAKAKEGKAGAEKAKRLKNLAAAIPVEYPPKK